MSHQHNLIAVYENRVDAEDARVQLMAEGIEVNDIGLSDPYAPPPAERPAEPSFWDKIWGTVPAADREHYNARLRQDQTIVSVRVSDADYERAMDILEKYEPIDVTESGSAEGDETEQVIPVVREQFDVGKRATEKRYRVRSYTIERPVEEQVALHDERVEIERWPATGPAAEMPQDRDIEVVEHHEEPVAAKRGMVEEEVVVRKKGSDRTETVRGTAGETRVEVEQEPIKTPTKPSRSTP